MPFPTITLNDTIEAAKVHYYLRLATDAPGDYKVATISTMLGLAQHFPNIESGATLEEALGQTINNTLGQQILLDTTVSSTMNVLGATPEDFMAMRTGADTIQNVNLDIIRVEAAANRPISTVAIGDKLTIAYNMKCTITLSDNDGQPNRITLSFSLTASPSEAPVITALAGVPKAQEFSPPPDVQSLPDSKLCM